MSSTEDFVGCPAFTNVDNRNNKLGMRLQLVAEKDKWSEREKRGLDII
jgi:hypothetical protein